MQVFYGLVDIGKRNDHRDGVTVDLGNLDKIIIHEQSKQLADIGKLRFSERRKPPVTRPGVVKNIAKNGQIFFQLFSS